MRCRACDIPIKHPITVTDQLTGEEHKEWMCHRCNTLSFAHDPPDGFDEIQYNLERDGYLSVDYDEGEASE